MKEELQKLFKRNVDLVMPDAIKNPYLKKRHFQYRFDTAKNDVPRLFKELSDLLEKSTGKQP